MSNTISINKYLPLAILYFFFNSFLLPHGLLYTTLLTPFFLIWLYRSPDFNYLWIFFLGSLLFACIHFLHGVDLLAYIKSYFLFFSVFVFCLAFRKFLKECRSLGSLFRSLLLLNVLFVLVALVALFIPPLKDRFWYNNAITSGINGIDRLKMLTYEPSYYSILLVPIALYYFLKMLLLDFPNKGLVFLMLAIPLLLSLSFGILLGLVLSLLILFMSDIKLFTLREKFPRYLLGGVVIAFVAFLIVLQLFPNNVFFLRIANVFAGKDTSFNGRTFDSFYLAWKIAAQKSILFGAGPGQVKSLGLDFFKEFYNYTKFTENDIGIPNSLGDTLAIFGLSGMLIRLGLEIFFFIRTKVYTNFLRLGLFIFVFIYQFTGSFATNIAEYVIWILAFSPWLFPEFDKKAIYARRPQLPDTGFEQAPALT